MDFPVFPVLATLFALSSNMTYILGTHDPFVRGKTWFALLSAGFPPWKTLARLCANAMGACNINEQHILALLPNQSYDVFAGEATLRILDLVTRTAKCQFICHTPKH